MYRFIRALLFILPAEAAHDLTLCLIRCVIGPCYRLAARKPSVKRISCFGIDFPNPVGLAAGLDKNGRCIDAWFRMGFGFVEVGTVTPLPQAGNPKPRMFRLTAKDAIINRMGFNNDGVDALVERLKRRKVPGVLGVNIGKNKETPLKAAAYEYELCMEKVYPWVDYITLNISSPNTPELRALQGEEYLDELLSRVSVKREILMNKHEKRLPILVKIAPDLTEEECMALVRIAEKHSMDGIIATNTTLDRSCVQGHPLAEEVGGLSGAPLYGKSAEVIEWLQASRQKGLMSIPVIAVGGIDCPEKYKALRSQGIDLIQVYSGFIYQGPGLLKRLLKVWQEIHA